MTKDTFIYHFIFKIKNVLKVYIYIHNELQFLYFPKIPKHLKYFQLEEHNFQKTFSIIPKEKLEKATDDNLCDGYFKT